MTEQNFLAFYVLNAGCLALFRPDKLMLVFNCQFQQLKLKLPLRIENAKTLEVIVPLGESKNSKLSRGKSRSTVH